MEEADNHFSNRAAKLTRGQVFGKTQRSVELENKCFLSHRSVSGGWFWDFGGASSLCLSVICFAEEKRDSQNARHVLAKVQDFWLLENFLTVTGIQSYSWDFSDRWVPLGRIFHRTMKFSSCNYDNSDNSGEKLQRVN